MILDVNQLNHVAFQTPNLLPEQCGVYFVCNQKEVLYIGKTKNLKRHHQNHDKYQEMLNNSATWIFYQICWEDEAQELRQQNIKHYDPLLNQKPRRVEVPEYHANSDREILEYAGDIKRQIKELEARYKSVEKEVAQALDRCNGKYKNEHFTASFKHFHEFEYSSELEERELRIKAERKEEDKEMKLLKKQEEENQTARYLGTKKIPNFKLA